MTAMTHDIDEKSFYVIHPIYDTPEAKHRPDALGEMEMSGSVRFSLMALRSYLILMTLLVFYHVLDLAGLFGHHVR